MSALHFLVYGNELNSKRKTIFALEHTTDNNVGD